MEADVGGWEVYARNVMAAGGTGELWHTGHEAKIGKTWTLGSAEQGS